VKLVYLLGMIGEVFELLDFPSGVILEKLMAPLESPLRVMLETVFELLESL